MRKRGYTKLLARHHTGKIREHKHTSYGSLLLVLLLTLVPLFSVSKSVSAGVGDTEGGGSTETFAVVEGQVPKIAPVLRTPVSGQTISTSAPLPVAGTCPGQTLVKVFINDILAGAALCENGSFSVPVAPFVGNNSIVARAYNTNEIPSPDSTPVNVQLVLPGVKLTGTAQLGATGAPAGQLFVTSEVFHRGAQAGEAMAWPLIINGGTPPYAVSVSWGDGKTDLISRSTGGRFDISHTYDKPGGYRGSYDVVVNITDQAGTKTFMHFVAIVSGDTTAGVVGSVKGGYDKSALLKTAWQLLAAAVIAVLFFWLGEKRELQVLKKRGRLA